MLCRKLPGVESASVALLQQSAQVILHNIAGCKLQKAEPAFL